MKPIHTKNRTIGLLGGSFNPAHGGHLHITLHALKKLQMDEVWWLVSPANPLKARESLAAYEKRLHSAQQVAKGHKGIRVLDIERQYHTRYTYETVELLKRQFPGTHFVWMMGADNLEQFHRWERWAELLIKIPLVVFDRAPYSHTSLRSKTFLRGRQFLLKSMDLKLPRLAPMLHFVHLRRDPMSSTFLRKKLGIRAFLGHT